MKKRNLFKTCLTAGLALVLGVGALAGCAGGGTKYQDDLEYDEFGDPIFDNVNLNVWSIIGDPDNVYLERVNQMFNDYYRENGVQAKVTSIANADFYTQVANTINTDPSNAPDVIIFHSERLNRLAADNIILPLEEYFEAAKTDFNADDYLSNVIAECYYENKLYGVPLDVHAGVWYVRSDILEKNGLEKPTSLSEFVTVCNTLIEKYENGTLWHRAMDRTEADSQEWTQAKSFGDTYNPVVMSQAGGIEMGWIPQTAVFQNGGKLTDANGYPAWNTDALEEIMEMFRSWQTGEGDFKGTPYNGAFVGTNDSAEAVWSRLASGAAVFSCEGPWWVESRLNEYEAVLGEKKDESGKTYAPLDILNMSKLYALDESAETASQIYGVGHCFSVCRTVSSKTKRVAAALYAKFMTENAVDYMQGGHLPAARAIVNSQQYKDKPFYSRYLAEFGNPEDFVMLGNTPHYTAVYECLKNVYADVFNPNKKTQGVKKLIDARYQEALAIIQSEEDL